MSEQLLIIGDSLLDRDVDGVVERLAPDAPVPVVDEESDVPRAGGAALAAVLAARDGITTTLVTALGRDEAGEEIGRLLDAEGVRLADIGATGRTSEKIRIRTDGRPIVRLDRGGTGGRLGSVDARVGELVRQAGSILVSDYGQGLTSHPPIASLVEEACSRSIVVWDPHPRGALPARGCRLVTPNLREAFGFALEVPGSGLGRIGAHATSLMRQWSVGGVVVTLGEKGALFVDGGAHPLMIPAPQVNGGDTCGAGDRFSVTVIRELARGSIPSEAVTRGVREASRYVASGGAGAVSPRPEHSPSPQSSRSEAARLAAQVRANGGTVVATGGCFDIVHAGHVAMLQAARRLGDCLIVCLNSDSSVQSLKGPGRPLNRCEDRAAVLTALASVDAVEVFDDLVPTEAIRATKPHIWAKGGDYGATPLPEADVLSAWGGQVVILPYLRGHSTSGILERAGR